MNVEQRPAQPREGIVGTLHDPPGLLSLDEATVCFRDAIINLVGHVQRATLVGNPAPAVEKMFQRMRHPMLGDWVVESTRTIYTRDADDRLKGFGVLLARRWEYASTDAEWAAEMADEDPDLRGDDNRPRADAWYVQYGPNPEDVCRWANCEFIMAPVGRDAFDTVEDELRWPPNRVT